MPAVTAAMDAAAATEAVYFTNKMWEGMSKNMEGAGHEAGEHEWGYHAQQQRLGVSHFMCLVSYLGDKRSAIFF